MANEFIALTHGVPTGVLVISATGHSHFGLGLTLAALGDPAEAQVAFARGREIYRLIDHHAVIGFTLLSELQDVVLRYFTTRTVERRQMAEAAEAALLLAAGAFPSDLLARRARLSLQFLEGQWDEANAIAEEVDAHGNYVLRRVLTNAMAPIWYWQWRTELVQSQIGQLLPRGAATEPGGCVFQDGLLLQRLGAAIAIDQSDQVAARHWIEANDRWLAWSGALLGRAENRLTWAAYYRSTGDDDAAVRYADEAIGLATEPEQPLAMVGALRLRGEISARLRQFDGAESDLTQALRLADACEAPFERALTLAVRAELRFGSGRVVEARQDVADASAIASALGARLLLDRIALTSARLTPVERGSAEGLTPRELEVLGLVAQGLTDADVAARLFISPRTVGQHLRSIYGKLDVTSRVGATRFAVDHGLA